MMEEFSMHTVAVKALLLACLLWNVIIIEKYRQIFVYTFCLINVCLSLSNDANKIKTLNVERA